MTVLFKPRAVRRQRVGGGARPSGPAAGRRIRAPAGADPPPPPPAGGEADLVMPRLDLTQGAASAPPPPKPMQQQQQQQRPVVLPAVAAKPPSDSHFWGKMAVLGLAAVLISERVTGQGAVQALDGAVGVPIWEVDIPVAALVGGCLLGALTPAPAAALKAATPVDLARGFLYRLAFAGLAATLVCEVATGRGALAWLELETGMGEVSEIEAFSLFVGLLFVVGGGGGENNRRA